MLYLVHKHTKEHRRYADALDWTDADCMVVEGDPDGWIEWHGGECPLPGSARVTVRYESRVEFEHECRRLRWHHTDCLSDIIAYRPILDAELSIGVTRIATEPPAWDGEGLPPVGCECEVRHLHSTDLEWRRIKITSITNDYVVGYVRDDRESAIRRGPLLEFRPIRSEEDRITEELERIMYKPAMTREMAARIYEAIRDGKVPGVKLTGGE